MGLEVQASDGWLGEEGVAARQLNSRQLPIYCQVLYLHSLLKIKIDALKKKFCFDN